MAVGTGSIVIWTSAAGQFGANVFSALETHPAIVTKVWNAAAPQSVNLHVLPDNKPDFTISYVPEDDTGTTPNSWAVPTGAF